MGFVRDVWRIATGRAVAVDVEAEVERRVAERLRIALPKNTPLEPDKTVDLGKVFPVASEHLFVGTGWVKRRKQVNKENDPFGPKYEGGTEESPDEPTVTVNAFKDGWVRYQYGNGKYVKDERRALDEFMEYWEPFDKNLADNLNKLKEL